MQRAFSFKFERRAKCNSKKNFNSRSVASSRMMSRALSQTHSLFAKVCLHSDVINTIHTTVFFEVFGRR